MSETKETPKTDAVMKRLPGFQPGHMRWGGKKKRTAQMARDLAEKLGVDPLEFLLKIVHSDTYTQTVIGPDGKKQKQEIMIDLATRIDAAKAVAGYFYPRLNSTAVTGGEGGPIETVTFDMAQLLDSPEAVEAAQRLALLMAEQDRPAPARILPPGDTYEQK